MNCKHLPCLATVLVIITFMAGTVMGQYFPMPFDKGELQQLKSEPLKDLKNASILWSEDFANGLPATWQNVDLNGFCGFTYSTRGPQGPFSLGMPRIASQTAQNGFMILDSDLCSSQRTGTTNAYIQGPPIPVPANTNLMLTFQHNFRYCCSPAQTLLLAEVSIDGINWTSFDVRNGLAPNNTSANPVFQAIDISHLVTQPGEISVRFRKTGATHYWWMIDDVQLVSFVDNDLEITDYSSPAGYTKYPHGQFPPLLLQASVRNAGGKVQNEIVFNTSVNEYLTNSIQTHPALQPSQIITFSEAELFTPPGRGNYEVVYSVSQKQVDMKPENNRVSFSFQITDSTYSRTGSAADQEISLLPGNETLAAAANIYEIVSPLEITSLSFTAVQGTEEGAAIKATIYKSTAEGWEEIVSAEPYLITADQATQAAESGIVITVPLEMENDLVPGIYLVAVHVSGAGALALAAESVTSESYDGSFTLTSGNWEASTKIPFIDLHAGNNVAPCNLRFHLKPSNSLCGSSTGKIEAIALNGEGPFFYAWEGFLSVDLPVLEGLSQGKYSVTITDAYGCEFTGEATVEDEDILVSSEVTNAVCNSGGRVVLTPLNGTQPFTYSWVHDPSLIGAVAEGLQAGSFEVTISDVNQCSTTITVQVGSVEELPVMVSVQDAYCGSQSGSIELFPQAGNAPYTFQWNGLPTQTQSSLKDVAPGAYSFTVTDSNNCRHNGTATVGIDNYDLNIVVDKTNTSCGLNNGRISLEVTNGQKPFVYQWDNGDTGLLLEDIAQGTYTVNISDKFGCTGSQSVTIDNLGNMPNVSMTVTDSPGCAQQGGALNITATDQSVVYEFTYLGNSNASKLMEVGSVKSAGFNLVDIASGIYYVKIVNSDGCELFVDAKISDAAGPSLTPTMKMVTCYGMANGSLSVDVAGGQSPQFLWNDEDKTTTSLVQGLKAGTYTVIVSDGDCKVVESFDVTQPAKLTATGIIDHIICANDQKGGVNVSISGGTHPMSYIWNNGNTNRSLSDVNAGTYTINITDFNECKLQQSFTITSNDSLIVAASLQQPTSGQADGRIMLTVKGGKGNYSFAWNHGPQSSVLTGLAADTYTVTVSDDAGCSVVKTFMLAPTSVNEYAGETFTFAMYPNPVDNQVNIQLSDKDPLITLSKTVEVVNILGSVVLKTDFEPGLQNLRLDVSSLNRGVYFLRITAGNLQRQSRLVKK